MTDSAVQPKTDRSRGWNQVNKSQANHCKARRVSNRRPSLKRGRGWGYPCGCIQDRLLRKIGSQMVNKAAPTTAEFTRKVTMNKKRILLVDDEVSFTRLLKLNLE